MSNPVRLAQGLEADASRYPEERSEILLEAADAWRAAGGYERAVELLTEVIEAGGEDGCQARFQLAEVHFERGAADEVEAELAALARDPALNDGICQLVAELLDERGDLAGAARWYDRAVARLDSDTIDGLQDRDDLVSTMAGIMLRHRRDVRERLGLAPDTMDELVAEPLSPPTEFPAPPTDLDGIRERLAAGARPQEVRLLTFQRAERAEALRRWPGEYEGEEYYDAAERRWRKLAAEGVASIRVVPGSVAELVAFAEHAGVSPADSAVRVRYCETVPLQRTIAWPPPRNAPCWCGSDTKYKKCCGRPG
jgi:tetratricopeptide (TPR) repeat protein